MLGLDLLTKFVQPKQLRHLQFFVFEAQNST